MAETGKFTFSHREVIAKRYRVYERLGRGGMAEVYRAEDLHLMRFVALKVPLAKRGLSEQFRSRLRSEVRIGREIAHPNVLKIYDLYDDGRQWLLSMELIEGDTLHRILKRKMGPLTAHERMSIAIDLCAGLGAIHDRGVIHRDLKPQNVMIDDSGRAVITDFGLADYQVACEDPSAGTLEYLAPEQLAEGRVSQKSDLYSLGVLLHEIFTGEHPYLGDEEQDLARDELARRQLEGPPCFDREPAAAVLPAVQQTIQACLDPDPQKRPGSVREVAEKLHEHGGDWFLRNGRPTPVYRLLVAPEGGLSARAAGAGLAAGVAGLLLVALLSQWTQPAQAALGGEAPLALESEARGLARRLGFDPAAEHRRYGYAYRPGPWAARPPWDSATEPGGGPAAAEPPVRFWYRQSPRPLTPVRPGSAFARPDDPPPTPGTVRIDLDPSGRLLHLSAVPSPAGAASPPAEPEWRVLFEAAGLDLARFETTSPDRVPAVFAEQLRAWETETDPPRGPPIRVEAASTRGLPVEFGPVGIGSVELGAVPRSGAEAARDRDAEEAPVLSSRIGGLAFALGFGVILAAVVWLAWRNFHHRLADRAAAFRLALLFLCARIVAGVLGAPHVASLAEVNLVWAVLARALLVAALVWIIYVALEPLARHAWPERSASWVRMLYGRVEDRLLGRDLLCGALFGIAALLWARVYGIGAAGLLGLDGLRHDRLGSLTWILGQREIDLQLEALTGLRHALSMELYAATHGALMAFFLVAGVLLVRFPLSPLLRLVLRRSPADRELVPASRAAAFGLLLVLTYPAAGDPALDLIAAAGASLLWLAALIRFGFLAAVTATVVTWLLGSHPLALAAPGWALLGIWVPILAVAAMLVWGCLAAIGRVPSWRARRPGPAWV